MIKGTLTLGAADFSKKALLAATVLICARFLPRPVFGDYMFLLSFYQVFAVLAGAGIPNALVRQVARHAGENLQLFAHSILARVVYVILVAALMYGVVLLAGYPARYQPLIFLMGWLMAFRGATENAISIFQAQDDQLTCAKISLVQSFVALAGTLIVCLRSKTLFGLIGVLVIAALASSVVSIVALYAKSQSSTTLDHSQSTVRSMIRDSGWLNGGAFLASAYNRIDVLLLRRLANAEAVAAYSAPYRLLDLTQILPSSVMGVLLPRLCRPRDGKGHDVEFSKVLRYLLVLALLVIAIVTFGARAFTKLLLGSGYISSTLCLQMLVLAVFPMFWNFALNSKLIAIGYDRAIVWSAAVALTCNVVLNIALIPRYGFLACAAITFVTELSLLTMNIFLITRRGEHAMPDALLRLLFSTGCIAAFWLLWISDFARPWAVGLAVLGIISAPVFRRDFVKSKSLMFPVSAGAN